jgi:hypothetical protein
VAGRAQAERSRRDTVARTLTDSKEHKICVAEAGLDYVLRGRLIAQVYEHEVESPEDLGDWLRDGLYIDAMHALGRNPTLHIRINQIAGDAPTAAAQRPGYAEHEAVSSTTQAARQCGRRPVVDRAGGGHRVIELGRKY